MTLCNDAESALVHIGKDDPYDILISDFMLPGISGLDLITQLRQNQATSRMPIVMISGHKNYAMDERASRRARTRFSTSRSPLCAAGDRAAALDRLLSAPGA